MNEFVEVAAAEAAAEAVADIAATAGAVAAQAASDAAEREQHIIDAAAQAARVAITDEDEQWNQRLENVERTQSITVAELAALTLRVTTLEAEPAQPTIAVVEAATQPMILEPQLPLLPSLPEENALSGEGALPEAVEPPKMGKAGKRAVSGWV